MGRAKGIEGLVIQIQGKPVRVTYETVAARSVKLDFDNPRIRLQIERKLGKRGVSEDELIGLVRSQPGFSDLQRAVRENNGLHDPLLVKHNSVVAEGNSRLAIYRILSAGKPDDPRWQSVPIMRLPKDISDSAIAALLASYHVAGKTPWRKYAKAEHLAQLRNTHRLDVAEIARATRMSPKEIEDNLKAFEYFQKELAPGADAEVMEDKFSHALELIKGKKLADIRDDPEKRRLITKLIREDKLTGLQVRHAHKLFENKQTVAALKKGRVEVARRAIEKTDPTLTSKFLKQMRALDHLLRDLTSPDMQLLKTNAAAADILISLSARITDLATATGIKLGVNNGAARSKRA
jgi:hypothetical protein